MPADFTEHLDNLTVSFTQHWAEAATPEEAVHWTHAYGEAVITLTHGHMAGITFRDIEPPELTPSARTVVSTPRQPSGTGLTEALRSITAGPGEWSYKELIARAAELGASVSTSRINRAIRAAVRNLRDPGLIVVPNVGLRREPEGGTEVLERLVQTDPEVGRAVAAGVERILTDSAFGHTSLHSAPVPIEVTTESPPPAPEPVDEPLRGTQGAGVLHYLRKKPHAQKLLEISRGTGVPYGSTNSVLAQLLKARLVVRIGGGGVTDPYRYTAADLTAVPIDVPVARKPAVEDPPPAQFADAEGQRYATNLVKLWYRDRSHESFTIQYVADQLNLPEVLVRISAGELVDRGLLTVAPGNAFRWQSSDEADSASCPPHDWVAGPSANGLTPLACRHCSATSTRGVLETAGAPA